MIDDLFSIQSHSIKPVKGKVISLQLIKINEKKNKEKKKKTCKLLLLQAVNDARIHGLWRRGIQSRTRDKARLLRAFCVTEFYSSIKEIEKVFDIDIRRGQKVSHCYF